MSLSFYHECQANWLGTREFVHTPSEIWYNPPAIKGSGYVVKSLEAALWAFFRSSTFREGCLLAVNLGDDADTTGAVYGQLAGAFYGVQDIPQQWLAHLAQRQLIESLADQLFHQSIILRI